jgi:AMMECR1 domain-containing protein
MSQESEDSPSAAAKDAAKAAEFASANIRRFLELQAKEMGPLKMQAHQEELRLAGEAARLSAELSAVNIQRFLNLQAKEMGPLKMQAHSADSET